MNQKPLFTFTPLCEMAPGHETDTFALMIAKDEAVTKTGKPYFRVGFRDSGREVNFPIWGDSVWADDCKSSWEVGKHYKIRATLQETDYGSQLDIKRIREVTDRDYDEGFSLDLFLPRSVHDPEEMFNELVTIAKEEIDHKELSALTVDLLESNQRELLTLPAATRNHHAYLGGFLEHVLSVTRNAVMLGHKYLIEYPELRRDLVVAGAILHDIGKLRELSQLATGAVYSPAGELIGHILLGRDLVRDAAREHEIDAETLLRLEHIIVSHQRLPEWGSPKQPMTPEAWIVHMSDDLDAGFHMMVAALRDDDGAGPMTSKIHPLRSKVFRGLPDTE